MSNKLKAYIGLALIFIPPNRVRIQYVRAGSCNRSETEVAWYSGYQISAYRKVRGCDLAPNFAELSDHPGPTQIQKGEAKITMEPQILGQ